MKSFLGDSVEKATGELKAEGFCCTMETGDFRNDPISVSAACFGDHSELTPCSTLDSSLYMIHDTCSTCSSLHLRSTLGVPSGSFGQESTCNTGDPGSVPGSGRSPGERNGNPFQYSCLENPMDGGAWRATVHGITKNET